MLSDIVNINPKPTNSRTKFLSQKIKNTIKYLQFLLIFFYVFFSTYQKSRTWDPGPRTRTPGWDPGLHRWDPGNRTPVWSIGTRDPRHLKWDPRPGNPKFSSGTQDPGPLKWDVNEWLTSFKVWMLQ